MVLILSTGSFPFRGLIVYMVGDVTRGAGPQFLYRAREIPLLWISRPWGLNLCGPLA